VSDGFERFVGLLGEKVELNGWTKYRAGLDVKSTCAPHGQSLIYAADSRSSALLL